MAFRPGSNTGSEGPRRAIEHCLVWTMFGGCVPPAPAIAVDEDRSAQDTAIIDARLAVGLRHIARKPRHLRVARSEQISHVTAFSRRCVTLIGRNQRVPTLVGHLLDELGFEPHLADAGDLAVDVVIAADDADAAHLGADLDH